LNTGPIVFSRNVGKYQYVISQNIKALTYTSEEATKHVQLKSLLSLWWRIEGADICLPPFLTLAGNTVEAATWYWCWYIC